MEPEIEPLEYEDEVETIEQDCICPDCCGLGVAHGRDCPRCGGEGWLDT